MSTKMGSISYNYTERSRLLSQAESIIDIERNREVAEFKCFGMLRERIEKFLNDFRNLVIKGWEFGRSDPRKIIFSAKVGFALAFISVLIFYNEPLQDMGTNSVWAILTVVVVFEFSIGATLSKGFNRALGTLSAGGLALGVAELSILTGNWEEVVIVIGIFVAGFFATFMKMYPTLKPYEYGFRVFLLTYCIVLVSGNKTREFIQTAVSRFLLIAVGAAVTLVVNICIYPIWAGEDLHNLVVKNFMGVADSLEGCVNGYLQCVEYERIPSKILPYQASDVPLYSGYRSAIQSTNQEDTLEDFASWEPPHGRYMGIRYPWKDYVKLSDALRHCAFMVMALHGCILSEIQASPESRQVFRKELQKVGTEGAKVLRELGRKVKMMTKLNPGDILLQVHAAAEELQKKIDQQSQLFVRSTSREIRIQPEYIEDYSKQGLNLIENERKHPTKPKFHSENLLDLRPVQSLSSSWDARNSGVAMGGNSPVREGGSRETMFMKQISWPSRYSIDIDAVRIEDESGTYESASAMSLATFASLLIEFVARLQYLVTSFEELSEQAKFKESVVEPGVETVGFWTRLSRRLRSMD